MAAQRVRPDRRGDGPFVRGGGLAGTGGLSVDSDYSGRPLPELTEADVRRATDSLGEDPGGEILQLSDGTPVSFARGGWYELVPGRVDFDKPVEADRIPPPKPGGRTNSTRPPTPGDDATPGRGGTDSQTRYGNRCPEVRN